MWYHPNVLDNGLVYLRNEATALHVINGFAPETDTRASVIAGSLGTVAYAAADMAAPANHAPDGRAVVGNPKNITMTGSLGAGAGDVKLALISASIVLAVADETTERAISDGEVILWPGPVYILRQPA